MAEETYVKYSRALAFERVDVGGKAAQLIRFGRDLYRESLGSETAFFRDYGRYGAGFPIWVAACADADPAFAQFLVEDGVDIGLVVLGHDNQEASVGRVHHFYMQASHRGRGFGGLLDDYARETLARVGARRARLNVAARNDRAIRFYEGQGWEKTYRRGGLIFMETKLQADPGARQVLLIQRILRAQY